MPPPVGRRIALNPVMPVRYGVQVVDIKLRLARIGDEPDPLARRLR